jgi:hypothetical protein
LKIKNLILLLSASSILASCTTLDKSFQLGGLTGSAVGASAAYLGSASQGSNPDLQEVAIASSVGFGIGLIASYFIHQSVIQEREALRQDTELYFGDLPPSPFLMPSSLWTCPSNR